MLEEMKKCPFCAEEIKAEAVKCKHCKSSLLPTVEEKIPGQKDKRKISGSNSLISLKSGAIAGAAIAIFIFLYLLILKLSPDFVKKRFFIEPFSMESFLFKKIDFFLNEHIHVSNFTVLIFIYIFICWCLTGIIVGVTGGCTGLSCSYKKSAVIGFITGIIVFFVIGGNWYIYPVLGCVTGYLASFIERKYFRRMNLLSFPEFWKLSVINNKKPILIGFVVIVLFITGFLLINNIMLPYVWNYKGEALLKSGNGWDALEYFDNALKKQPHNSFVLCNKGKAFNLLGKYDEAISCCDEALKISRKNKSLLKTCTDVRNVAECNLSYNKGMDLYNQHKYEESIEYYNKALYIEPANEKYLAAKKQARTAIEKKEEASILYNKGKNLYNQNKYKEAIAYYDKASGLDPDNDTYSNARHQAYSSILYNKGKNLYNQNKYKEAIEYYDKALELYDKDEDVWYDKGNILALMGYYDEAIECYDSAIYIDRNFAYAWCGKGNALASLGRADEAIVCYRLALRAAPDNKYVQKCNYDANNNSY